MQNGKFRGSFDYYKRITKQSFHFKKPWKFLPLCILFDPLPSITHKSVMAELCFHFFVYFVCVPINIFGSHHKECDSNQKDFTFVKFTSQMFSSADESLMIKTCLLMLKENTPNTWMNESYILVRDKFFEALFRVKNLNINALLLCCS